jgi:hypothetical protein
VALPGLGRADGEERLIYGAHMSVTGEEKRCHNRMHKPEKKVPLGEYAKACRVGGAEWGGSGL